MRARTVALAAALAVVAGSIGAAGWAWATRDARRLRALEERVRAELDDAAAHPPGRRVLRGTPGVFVALPARSEPGDPAGWDADVALVRSAIACERPVLLDFVRGLGANDLLARWPFGGTWLETSQHALDLWRLRHDIARAGTVGDLVAFGQPPACLEWQLIDGSIDPIDRAAGDELLGELEILRATRPSLDGLLTRSGLALIPLERARLELEQHERDEAMSGAPAPFVTRPPLDAARAHQLLEAAGVIEERIREARTALGEHPSPAAIRGAADGRSAKDLDGDARAWSGGEVGLDLAIATAIRHAVDFWAADLTALRVARVALLCKKYRIERGAWPASLESLLGRAAGDEESHATTGETLLVFPHEPTGALIIDFPTSERAWMVLMP